MCYDVVMHHCNMQDNKKLLDICLEQVRDFINSDVRDKLFEVTGVQLLHNLSLVWDSLVIYALSMDRLFQYLNSNFLRNTQRPLIPEQILILFKREVFDKVKQKISDAILEQIDADRNQQNIPKDVVKKSIQVLAELGLENPKPRRFDGRFEWTGKTNLRYYNELLAKPLLEDTRKISEKQAKNWMLNFNCPEYCHAVVKFFDNEEQNADYWLQFE